LQDPRVAEPGRGCNELRRQAALAEMGPARFVCFQQKRRPHFSKLR
jgi:hypothetical protein